MILNAPTILTWSRLMVILLVVGVFYLPMPEGWLTMSQRNVIAMVLFIGGSITDLLDGYLARKWNQTSAFGAFLDPIADKLMVAGALLVLVDLGRIHGLEGFIIIGREIVIGALREWMATIGESDSVAVSQLGKVKTILQLIAISMLLFHDNFLGLRIHFMGYMLLWAAIILTVWSMIDYLWKAWPYIRDRSG